MNPDAVREQLVDRLLIGRENAISAQALAREFGTTPRMIGQLIERAIVEGGFCIGSLCGERHGYYLVRAGDPDDLAAGVAHSVRRAAATFVRARAMQRNYERLPGAIQSTIFDELDAVVAS